MTIGGVNGHKIHGDLRLIRGRQISGDYHAVECSGCGLEFRGYTDWTEHQCSRALSDAVGVKPVAAPVGEDPMGLRAMAMSEPQGDVAPATDLADARKMDMGKMPVWQGLMNYFPRAMIAIALVSEYGKRKYAPSDPVFNTGWAEVKHGTPRYMDALNRHQLKQTLGHDYDEESDMAHMAHAAWNMLAVLERGLREGHLEARRGNIIGKDGKPILGTSKKVDL